jgi:mevalonate kinase
MSVCACICLSLLPHSDVVPTAEQCEQINHLALVLERIHHGNPSGLDNAISTHGGTVMYVRGEALQQIEKVPSLRFLITNTKKGRSTKALVAGVG